MPISPRTLLLALLSLPLLACDAPPSSGGAASATPIKAEIPAAASIVASVAAPPTSAPAAEAPAPIKAPVVDVPAPLDVAAPPADAKKTASGLVSKVLTPGKGKAHPKPEEMVKVNFTGWTKAGKMFDSTTTDGQPASFRVNGVIKGWTEGLQLMVAGEKRRLWIPAALAYGDHPMPGSPSGDLVFDVELLDITAAPKPPPVPPDVKAPPATATKTASGLAYRVIKKGTGAQQPKATDGVVVNYTGWTPDGKMFDSSVTSGEPISFTLDHVIKGWTEGLQLMKVGDVVRFWIPSNLAYGDKPTGGRPGGMLVFDVELIAIK